MCCSVFAIAGNEKDNKRKNPALPQPSVIDALDSVVLDLSQQVITGNSISFPVSILTDDTVFSLDFSFKYDHSNFTYDTITDLANYLQSVSFYNTNDSTVRYTSFSLQGITIDTNLVAVHFITLGGGICSPDLNTVKVYLNGELCSFKIIQCSFTGIPDLSNKNNFVNVYPNPASSVLNIESSENVSVELVDLNGKTIIHPTAFAAGEKQTLKVSNIASGIYFFRIYHEGFLTVQKVVINN